MSTIYAKAIEVLEAGGWTRGLYENGQGECCLIGALCKGAYGRSAAPYNKREVAKADRFLQDILLERGEIVTTRQYQEGDYGPDQPVSVIDWNDQVDRTVDQVIELLREADRRASAAA